MTMTRMSTKNKSYIFCTAGMQYSVNKAHHKVGLFIRTFLNCDAGKEY